jgi:hypothetical protein
MNTDDELLLYYYRDGLEPADRARIAAALADQPELAQRLHKLVNRLDQVAAIPEVKVPLEAQQRWKAALEQAAAQRPITQNLRPRRPFTDARWLAAAAAVVVAIVSVFYIVDTPPPSSTIANVTPPPESEATTEAAEASAYERGLKTHLASTERQLASLDEVTPEERARLIETIIEQNRLYALAAERAGEPQLARVLRAFSPVLESMRQGEGNPAADAAQLSFELRVMQGRLAGGLPANTVSTL